MDNIEDIKYKINLKDISSSFIINKIFSFLSEKEMLNMIIYNKELKNMLFVDIKYYKKISCRYKIGEKNGKGREFLISTNKLVFEGEYLNGKRKGKGIEYYNGGELKFKGEYLNGKRNGKGKEYYDDDKLMFEGEYINGKRWNGKGYNKSDNIEFEIKNGKGNVKEYYDDGELEFEGDYLNGKRNGKGVEYYDDGNIEFEGEYLNGKINGKGKDYFKNGHLKFEGEYLNGKKWNGKIYNKNVNVEFEIKNGNGNEKEYNNNDELVFEG